MEAELANLGWSDVEFVGRGESGAPVLVGVEIKRLTELTSDWDRLVGHQIPKMMEHYDHRWLVVWGGLAGEQTREPCSGNKANAPCRCTDKTQRVLSARNS